MGRIRTSGTVDVYESLWKRMDKRKEKELE